MALVIADRVRETTTTTGTGTITLGGAVNNFETFTANLSNSDTTYYAIIDNTNGAFEVGLGTFTASGTTLARSTIIASSNSNSAVNFGSGTKDVFITIPASKMIVKDASGNVSGSLGLDGDVTIVDGSNDFDVASHDGTNGLKLGGDLVTSSATELNILDGKSFVDEDNMASNSATAIPSQQSVKAYVDTQITAEDLDFQADSGGALNIDLDSETLTFTGGTGIDTSGSGNAVTFAIDSTVSTLTGSQTLTNKTLTTPTINGATIGSSNLATSSNGDINLAPNGTGKVVIKGNTNQGKIVLNCEANSHGQTIIAAPHSESANNVLTLPSTGGDARLVSTASTATLTNKTFGDNVSFGDNNITNVGDIAVDSISADGTDINVAVSDNSATAFTIKQGSDNYLVVDTANSSESVAIGTGISGTAVSIGHTTSETTVNDNLTVTGNLTVSGTTTTVDSTTINVQNTLVFEGSTANEHETTLTTVDPTGDRTISLPNQSGTLPVLAAASTTQITSTPEELNLLDGVSGLVQADFTKLAAVDSTAAELNLLDGSAKSTSSITIADSDAIIIIDGTTTKQIPASDIKTYAGGDSASKGFATAMAIAL
jgi:hypothetical protein